jgi:hypothetical protein
MYSDPQHDREIARVASRQQGNITTKQLRHVGLWPRSIAYRVARGSLHHEHWGVYSVGRPATTPLERASAAVLACGPTAALSHGSAMTLWGLWRRWDMPFEVTVAQDRRPRGIVVHLSRTLRRGEIRTHLGIRATTPARTLHDMAHRLTRMQLMRAVNSALVSNFMMQSHLDEFVSRHPSSPLAAFVSLDAGPTRSQLEDEFLAFCERYGLPTPKTDVIVGGYAVDAYFEAERVIVELDGWDFHSSRASFESDRERDADHLGDGIPTVRITHDRLHSDPDREAARLQRILARRGLRYEPGRSPDGSARRRHSER